VNEVGSLDAQLFPNPVSNDLRLMTNNFFNHIQVMDMKGRIILNLTFPDTKSSNIDVTGLESGLYFIIFEGDLLFGKRSFVKE